LELVYTAVEIQSVNNNLFVAILHITAIQHTFCLGLYKVYLQHRGVVLWHQCHHVTDVIIPTVGSVYSCRRPAFISSCCIRPREQLASWYSVIRLPATN